jgi:hypothetical protein
MDFTSSTTASLDVAYGARIGALAPTPTSNEDRVYDTITIN